MTELYNLPLPITGMESPCLEILPQKSCRLACHFEHPGFHLTLDFTGVHAFRCTYYTAIEPEMLHAAFGKVIDLGTTNWLKDVVTNLANARTGNAGVRHLAVCFDDGPLYEFICSSFNIN